MKSYNTGTESTMRDPNKALEVPVTHEINEFYNLIEQVKQQEPGQTLFSSDRGDLFMSGAQSFDLFKTMRVIDAALVNQTRALQKENPDRVVEPDLNDDTEADSQGVRRVVTRHPISPDRAVVIDMDIRPPMIGIEDFRIPRVDRLVVSTEEISFEELETSYAA